MTRHLKILVQVWMLGVALFFGPFQPSCEAATTTTHASCCCGAMQTCACDSEKSPQQMCSGLLAPSTDREVPSQPGFAAEGLVIVPAPIALPRDFYLQSAPSTWTPEAADSPPFGGSPPQAGFCLWLI